MQPVIARARKTDKSYSRRSIAGAFCALVPLSLVLGVELYYLPSEPLHWCLIGVTLTGITVAARYLIRGLMER